MLSDVKTRIIILFAAFILDLLMGDPRSLTHPVVYMGKLIHLTEEGIIRIFDLNMEEGEDKGKKLIAGVLLTLIVTSLSLLVPSIIVFYALRINKYLGCALEIFWCSQLLAVRSLFTEAMKVYRALKAGDEEGGRLAVSMIVGRDTGTLDRNGIIKAAIETVAENVSDGVIAPMFYMVIFGLPGMFFYKAVNTLDSMVGYKNERYLYLGRASARLDDLLNLIPSRLSGLFVVWASGLCGFSARDGMRIFLRDRKNHTSPNSAHCEAAMAGALGLQLGGDARYFGKLCKKKTIGDDLRSPEDTDIRNACKIMLTASFLAWLMSLLVLFLLR